MDGPVDQEYYFFNVLKDHKIISAFFEEYFSKVHEILNFSKQIFFKGPKDLKNLFFNEREKNK